MRFTNYQKAVSYLIHEVPKTSRKVFDDSEAIEKNFRIMEVLDNPQNAHKAIHVAGTSGKGTVCYLIDALFRAHSKTVGMTQSPHVYDIRERIQINGQLISEKKFTRYLTEILDITRAAAINPSYFEVVTAMAYAAFRDVPLSYVVLETGFGGRLDASNVVTRRDKVCVLSKIGFDHMEALGETLEKIAAEKAGIIQPGNYVVALKQEPEVNAVFEARCKEVNAEIVWVEQTGDYQKTNDALASTVCRYIANRDGWVFDDSLAESILQQVFIPGRFEKRHLKDHLVILDGAHNPQKLAAMAHRVQRERKYPATIIFSIGERKDIAKCLEVLQPIAKRIIATEFFTKEQDIPKRPVPADEIASICQELGMEVHTEKSPHDALNRAVQFAEPIIITGSFYLLGEIDPYF